MKTRHESPTGRTTYLIPALAAVLALAIAACGKKEEGKEGEGKAAAPKEGAVIRVVVAPVKTQPFEDWGAYSADLRGVRDAVLTAGAGGRVEKVDEVGRIVRKGQALCDIESARYGAMLQQARSALDIAKGEVDRNKVNVEKGFLGKAALDQSDFAYQQARVGVLTAQRAYEDSRCQAPFDGILASRQIEAFQTVAPGSPTVRVASIDRLEAVVSIPESEARDYREGQTAEFSLPQGEDKPTFGKLKSIDRAVEARNRTVTARIEVPNSGNLLRPGMVGRARILRFKYDKAVVIPSQAVLRLQSGTKVMLAKGGQAVEAAVKLGPAAGDNVVIESGIAEGDTLITTGAFQVSNGTKISY